MISRFKDSKIYLAGHIGLVGSRLLQILQETGFSNVIFPVENEVDLRNQAQTFAYITAQKPDVILLIAGKIRGNKPNSECTGEFLYDNLMIAANVIEAARINGVQKLVFLGSSGVYPRITEQPMKETSLLTGAFEPTTEPYALGKMAGLKLCQFYKKQYNCNFVSVIPPNLYGPGDYFNTERSHVIPALISKIHIAQRDHLSQITMRGTGAARREFMFVDDVCRGIIYLMDHYEDDTPINLGTGTDYSIKELCGYLCDITGFTGEVLWDASYPDGTPRNLMDDTKIKALGWSTQETLATGLQKTYEYYLKNFT